MIFYYSVDYLWIANSRAQSIQMDALMPPFICQRTALLPIWAVSRFETNTCNGTWSQTNGGKPKQRPGRCPSLPGCVSPKRLHLQLEFIFLSIIRPMLPSGLRLATWPPSDAWHILDEYVDLAVILTKASITTGRFTAGHRLCAVGALFHEVGAASKQK